MLYLACTTISSVDLAQYGVSLAKDWVSVKCGTMFFVCFMLLMAANNSSCGTRNFPKAFSQNRADDGICKANKAQLQIV